MNTTKKQIKEKEFDTVKFFRAIKEKISKDTYGMNAEQFREYLRQQKSKTSKDWKPAADVGVYARLAERFELGGQISRHQ